MYIHNAPTRYVELHCTSHYQVNVRRQKVEKEGIIRRPHKAIIVLNDVNFIHAGPLSSDAIMIGGRANPSLIALDSFLESLDSGVQKGVILRCLCSRISVV